VETQKIIIEADAQFWLSERDGIDGLGLSDYTGTNGLVFAGDGYAVMLTGINLGYVTVTADFRQDEPAPDFEGWDEVVDVSARFLDGPATFSSPSVLGGLPEYPRLPPGSYRLRVHARNRDAAHAAVYAFEEPIEEFLISTWPAPPAPETRHKQTDNVRKTNPEH
jgi:hypothetical protein